LFVGHQTISKAKSKAIYNTKAEILHEPREFLFESSIVRYGYQGHFG
jgi:hypothetical protein